MRMIRTMLTLLLAVVWLPVSAHCLFFESIGGLEILSCCSHEAPPEEATNHHNNDCATDACSVVESATYKSSVQRIAVPPLPQQIAFELPLVADLTPPYRAGAANPSDDVLAWLPTAWQFSARTALPPRAPSIVS